MSDHPPTSSPAVDPRVYAAEVILRRLAMTDASQQKRIHLTAQLMRKLYPATIDLRGM